MTNSAVCLLLAFFCGSHLALARQAPKECSKGPSYWCENLKQAADCGAVGHCISDVWEKQQIDIKKNEISDKFIRVFEQLKDIRDLLNEDYLAIRVKSACKDIPYAPIANLCKHNTARMEKYLTKVLLSDTTPETMCRVVGMCNNMKLEDAIARGKKKPADATKPIVHNKPKLLGAEQCTWGPSYWCTNFSTSRQCKATHHCVQRVWSKLDLPEDNDSICQICKDMVKQARDQLESNETQTDLKTVFEGSCALIPIKIVSEECKKLVDDFVPELVETLASQMNPDVVCSVAGLCNSARIDEMLENYNQEESLRTDCSNCRTTVGVLRKRFDATDYEAFLMSMLQVCREMGSLSDSCSMLVFKYYENIRAAVNQDFTPHSVCHLSGQCSVLFHTHNDYNFPDDITDVRVTDDVPCEFCEQLVKHLRDTLVANTTSIEFHKILTGLCKQTGQFKEECLSLVDQYYEIIYNFLVNEMKPDEVCKMMGLCGAKVQDLPIAPLLPGEITIKTIQDKLIGTDEANSYRTDELARVPLNKKQTNVRILSAESTTPPQLPVERMFINMPQNKATCTFCQYFLHYLQVELSDTNNEEKIKETVDKACDKFPKSVSAECKQFVSEYGPAVIALLVQEIDPASVCPALGLCPHTEEVRRVSINGDKTNCPLCLFAVEQLEVMLKSNRTEGNIRQALDHLCNHLSAKLRTQCVDFVDTYSKQLIEMLVADLSAQEICVFLKLCKDEVADPLRITYPGIDEHFEQKLNLHGDRNNFRKKSLLPQSMLEHGDSMIETNEIPDDTVNGRPTKPENSASTTCVICEFIMKEIDDQIKDKHNDDEIKKVVHSVCKHMPKSVRNDCDQFVEKYADLIINLLAQNLDPTKVCEELKLCKPTEGIAVVKEAILDCAVCETVVMAMKKVLDNDKVDRNIVHVIEKTCLLLPAKYNDRCHTMLEIYGDSIIHLIEDYGSKAICQKIGLCSDNSANYVHMSYRNSKN